MKVSTHVGDDGGDGVSERENTNVLLGSCDLLFFTANAKGAHRFHVSWNKESRAFLASSLTSGKAGDVATGIAKRLQTCLDMLLRTCRAAPPGFQLESRHKISAIWQICTLSFSILFATIVIEPL